jgi:uncharacterized protein (DUF433 family)
MAGQTTQAGAGEIYPGVTVDPQIVHGKPVFTGTRIMIAPVLGALSAGDTIEEVSDAYGLTPEQIQAALGYALELVTREQVYVIPASA